MEKNPIDRAILYELEREKNALSTYRLAKRVGVSWSTAQLHCYALESRKLIIHTWDTLNNLSYRNRQIWRLKTKRVVKDGK